MLQVLLLMPEAAARAALDRHRVRVQALRPSADGAGGALVDVSAGLQRPPSPLPQTGSFPAASPPLLLACVLRGAISQRPHSDLTHPRAALTLALTVTVNVTAHRSPLTFHPHPDHKP